MTNVLLVVHLMLAIGMIAAVLLQRSEGGGLGIGGGGGGSGLLSGRGTANLLTRTTAVLAAGFMFTSLSLTILAASNRAPRSILEDIPTTNTAPAQPERPSVPVQ